MSNSAPRIVLGAVLVLIGACLGYRCFNQFKRKSGIFGNRNPDTQKSFPIDSFGKALFAGLLWDFCRVDWCMVRS